MGPLKNYFGLLVLYGNPQPGGISRIALMQQIPLYWVTFPMCHPKGIKTFGNEGTERNWGEIRIQKSLMAVANNFP